MGFINDYFSRSLYVKRMQTGSEFESQNKYQQAINAYKGAESIAKSYNDESCIKQTQISIKRCKEKIDIESQTEGLEL